MHDMVLSDITVHQLVVKL